jgi:TolA-binding protein
MKEAEIDAFEAHLSTCEQCGTFTKKWDAARAHLDLEIGRRLPNIDKEAARVLIGRARTADARRPSRLRRPAIIGAFAAAAVIIMMLAVPRMYSAPSKETLGPLSFEMLYPMERGDHKERPTPKELAARDERVLARVGKARIGVDANSRVRLVRADREYIQLDLVEGRIAVSIPPEKRRAQLSIRAGRFEVSVKGTEFLTEKEVSGAVSVSVRRGVVQVVNPGAETWNVEAGSTLALTSQGKGTMRRADEEEGRALSLLLDPLVETEVRKAKETSVETGSDEIQNKSRNNGEGKEGKGDDASKSISQRSEQPPDLESVKQWIIHAEYERSERTLKHRLSDSPHDVAALQLLSLCLQKSGKQDQAVETCKQIIAVGSPAERNRARFRAGAILQNRRKDKEAIAMFEDYLNETGDKRANAAEAKMRLAESVRKTGDLKRYEQILTTVVKEHGGTEAAEKAGLELARLKDR